MIIDITHLVKPGRKGVTHALALGGDSTLCGLPAAGRLLGDKFADGGCLKCRKSLMPRAVRGEKEGAGAGEPSKTIRITSLEGFDRATEGFGP